MKKSFRRRIAIASFTTALVLSFVIHKQNAATNSIESERVRAAIDTQMKKAFAVEEYTIQSTPAGYEIAIKRDLPTEYVASVERFLTKTAGTNVVLKAIGFNATDGTSTTAPAPRLPTQAITNEERDVAASILALVAALAFGTGARSLYRLVRRRSTRTKDSQTQDKPATDNLVEIGKFVSARESYWQDAAAALRRSEKAFRREQRREARAANFYATITTFRARGARLLDALEMRIREDDSKTLKALRAEVSRYRAEAAALESEKLSHREQIDGLKELVQKKQTELERAGEVTRFLARDRVALKLRIDALDAEATDLKARFLSNGAPTPVDRGH